MKANAIVKEKGQRNAGLFMRMDDRFNYDESCFPLFVQIHTCSQRIFHFRYERMIA